MQIETTMIYYYAPTRMAKSKALTVLNAKMWSNSSSHPLLVGMQNVLATLEDNLEVSYKVKYTLFYD